MTPLSGVVLPPGLVCDTATPKVTANAMATAPDTKIDFFIAFKLRPESLVSNI